MRGRQLRLLIGAIVFSVVTAGQTGAAKPEERPSIEGTVSNSLTGEPLKKVTLIVHRFPDLNGAAYFTASSDAGGRFTIQTEPGDYIITAERTGFVSQTYR